MANKFETNYGATTPIDRVKPTLNGILKEASKIRKAQPTKELLDEQAYQASVLQILMTAMNEGRMSPEAVTDVVSTLLADRERKAHHDNLTGLYNRHGLDRRSEEVFSAAHRAHEPVTVAILDLDHFKGINDVYGHDTGDVVLQSAAHHVGRSVRVEDVAARIGGEEFTLIMPGLDTDHSRERLDQIREALPEAVDKGTKESGITLKRDVTASIGFVTTKSAKISHLPGLVKAADIALYQSKEHGRNRVTGGTI